MGRLLDAVKAKWGFGLFAETPPFAKTLSTTPVKILLDNPDRLSWDIFNLGVVAVYLGHNEQVSATNGYYLGSYGGHIGMVWDEDGELTGRELWAVAASGTPAIFIKSVVGV